MTDPQTWPTKWHTALKAVIDGDDPMAKYNTGKLLTALHAVGALRSGVGETKEMAPGPLLREQAASFLKVGTPWVAVPAVFLEDIARLALPRAGDVLQDVFALFVEVPSRTTSEIKEVLPQHDGKEVSNALGYLARRGHINRLGYGKYERVAPPAPLGPVAAQKEGM